jgi:hypothetical protein
MSEQYIQNLIQISKSTNEDNELLLNEYLEKLIHLVPYLKNNLSTVTNNNINNINNTNTDSLNDNLKYLNLNTNHKQSLTDLEILQSALDYILDLQDEINMNNI